MARGIVFRWRGEDIGDPTGFSPVPAGIDYDLWDWASSKSVRFTRNLVHYNWHWHLGLWKWRCGQNQGIHAKTDLCMWGLDVGLPTKDLLLWV